MNYSELIPYCRSDRQREIITALAGTDTQTEAAEALQINKRSLERCLSKVRKNAALAGFSPDHDMTHAVPDGFQVRGVSTLYNSEGIVAAQWVKSRADFERQKHLMEQAALAMAEELTPVSIPKPSSRNLDKDIIPWVQIGDAHIGMLAYSYEVGHNFDLKIAEEELTAGILKLLNDTAPCERVVIQDCGDFTHYENISGTTEASGHSLDVDGRFNLMIAVYVRIMRRIVEAALARFKYVDVIINQGNHSRTNDLWMPHLLRSAYPTDRLNVLDNSSVFIPYRMGNTFVLCHHTDKCKPEKLSGVMAEDFRQDWGESKYRYIDGGHIHHKRRCIELTGAIYESWNQMAPGDKYAHDGGWRSRSFLQIVDRSKTYGEVARRTVPVEQVQDILQSLPEGESVNKRREVYTV